MKYRLLIYCNGIDLSKDDCKNLCELKDTFEEAFEYYIGVKPNKKVREMFIKNNNYEHYDNSLTYSFDYYALGY